MIGIAGKKGSGKTYMSNFIKDKYKDALTVHIRSLAAPLKEAVKIIFSLTDEQLYGNEKERKDIFWEMSPRFIMQRMGTDLLRDQLDKDVWIKSFEKWYQNVDYDIVIIDDVRFENEINMIRRYGGFVIGIDSTCIKNDTHASENLDLSKCDACMLNKFDLGSTIRFETLLEELIQRKLEGEVTVYENPDGSIGFS